MARSDKPDNERSAAAHAARDERHQGRVWITADGVEVNILSHEHGVATVQPVGGGDPFDVPKDSLTRPED